MIDTIIMILEIIGTVAFAVSGSMTAMKRRLDVLGTVILGVITACGGGMLRDIILNEIPALFTSPLYVIISAITSLLMFVVFYIIKDSGAFEKKWYKDLLTSTDAIGLGVFVIVGANVTMTIGHSNAFLVIFSAVITAIGGGMIRDISVCKIPNIFCKHIYAIPTIIGAIIYYYMLKLNTHIGVAIPVVLVFIITIRLLAYKYELSLPRVNFRNIDNNK